MRQWLLQMKGRVPQAFYTEVLFSLFVGLGIAALGLGSRYPKKLIQAWQTKEYFAKPISQMEAYTTKIRGLRPSSLYHSEHLHGLSPVNRAGFASCTVCPPQHPHSYFIHGDMADGFGQTRCHTSSRTRCSCACSLTGREKLIWWAALGLLLAESADRGTKAVAETQHTFPTPEMQAPHEATTASLSQESASPTPQSTASRGSAKPCLHEENTETILPLILMLNPLQASAKPLPQIPGTAEASSAQWQ